MSHCVAKQDITGVGAKIGNRSWGRETAERIQVGVNYRSRYLSTCVSLQAFLRVTYPDPYPQTPPPGYPIMRAPEIPICRCECNVGSSPVVTDQSLVSGNSLLILLGVIGLVIALSNTALAFKVTYRDSETGQGREFAFDVKGKSKGQLGVFGSGKGLQITN